MKKLLIAIITVGRLSLSLFILTVWATSCQNKGDETLVLEELEEFVPIEEMIPHDLLAKLEEQMPIYDGSTPPDVSGAYLVNSPSIIYSTLTGDEYGDKYADETFRFYSMNANHVIKYESIQATLKSYSGKVSVSGSGNQFTAYFTLDAYSEKYSSKMATVLSGILTSAGIQDYRYAFLMLEKSDPGDELVDVNTIRIFKDIDGIARKTTWTGTRTLYSGQRSDSNKLIKRSVYEK